MKKITVFSKVTFLLGKQMFTIIQFLLMLKLIHFTELIHAVTDNFLSVLFGIELLFFFFSLELSFYIELNPKTFKTFITNIK